MNELQTSQLTSCENHLRFETSLVNLYPFKNQAVIINAKSCKTSDTWKLILEKILDEYAYLSRRI